jgi:hypothetical protein
LELFPRCTQRSIGGSFQGSQRSGRFRHGCPHPWLPHLVDHLAVIPIARDLRSSVSGNGLITAHACRLGHHVGGTRRWPGSWLDRWLRLPSSYCCLPNSRLCLAVGERRQERLASGGAPGLSFRFADSRAVTLERAAALGLTAMGAGHDHRWAGAWHRLRCGARFAIVFFCAAADSFSGPFARSRPSPNLVRPGLWPETSQLSTRAGRFGLAVSGWPLGAGRLGLAAWGWPFRAGRLGLAVSGWPLGAGRFGLAAWG